MSGVCSPLLPWQQPSQTRLKTHCSSQDSSALRGGWGAEDAAENLKLHQ